MKVKLAVLLSAALLVLLAVATNFSAEDRRLLLSPNTKLQLPAITAPKDSFEVRFTLELPDSLRLQRHHCRITASGGYVLRTLPAYAWALRDSAVIVLSTLDLTLRAQADSSGSFQMRFDFANLDQPERNRGAAWLTLGASDAPLANLVAVSDSSQIESAADSSAASVGAGQVEDPAEAQGRILLWVMIAVIVLGVLLLAVLSVMSGAKSRDFASQSQLTSRSAPATKTNREKDRAASFATTTSSLSPKITEKESRESYAATNAEDEIATLPIPANRLAFLYKEAEPAGGDNGEEASGMNAMVAQLRVMTAATQQALAAQHEMLERLAQSVKPENGNSRLPQNASEKTSEMRAVAGGEMPWNATASSGRWDLAVETKTSGASLEEIVEAIDGVVAASATKPLLAPPSITAVKIDSLRRLAERLQKIAAACHEAGAQTEAATAENLRRKAAELALNYEAWVNSHALKLSLHLPNPGKDSRATRKEIMDSLLDGLYETRKIAVQGPIYFDRCMTQLMNDDVPKLRMQTEALENASIKNLWEGI